MVRQCTQPKRTRNVAWHKEKAMLIEAQETGQILDEVQLVFLADPEVPDGQAVQTIIPNTTTFQTEDLDTYDYNCDDLSNAQAVLMANLSNYEVLLTVMNSMSLLGEYVNMDGKRKESCNLEAELLKSQNAFNDLLKSTICKLKDIIKSLREKSKEENVNYDYCDIETKNVELENSVAKLLLKNERLCNEINHVKQVFKEKFDSIKKTRVRFKEQSGSLIDKLNLKSAENEDLKAQIQDKVFVITSLKNDLRKIKGKEIVDIATQIL
ncbi:hypothetical protein Tco_0409401 [Tanacetum coccineum]